MFTGIVQAKKAILSIEEAENLWKISLRLNGQLLKNLVLGASVAVNGTCLTVSKIDSDIVGFDIIKQTLDVTCLGGLEEGDQVNLERSLVFGESEVGGHLLSGHIDTTAELVADKRAENQTDLYFQIEPRWQKYCFAKGYVALNGASLTIAEATAQSFKVCLIPETLRVTNLSELAIGDRVNLEIDKQTQTIVDSVERYLQTKTLIPE